MKKEETVWASTTNKYLYSGRTGAEQNDAANQKWAESSPEERVIAMGLSAFAIADDGSEGGITNLKNEVGISRDANGVQEIGLFSEVISEVKLNLLGVRHTFLGNKDFKSIVNKHDGSMSEKSRFEQGFLLSQQLFQTMIVDQALKSVDNIQLSVGSNGRPRVAFTSSLPYLVGMEFSHETGMSTPTNRVTLVLEFMPEFGSDSWKIITSHPGEIWNQ